CIRVKWRPKTASASQENSFVFNQLDQPSRSAPGPGLANRQLGSFAACKTNWTSISSDKPAKKRVSSTNELNPVSHGRNSRKCLKSSGPTTNVKPACW